jgi:glycosyltransferase involved in cell wall biosynthesis
MLAQPVNLTTGDAVAARASAGRLRVLHLSAGNMYGGVETLLHTLAQYHHLCPGMEAHFALCFEGRLSRELTATGVPLHNLGGVRISRPWTVWRARRRLGELLRRERYDAVVCHLPWPLAVFGAYAKTQGCDIVFWAHGVCRGTGWVERMARRVQPCLTIANSAFVRTTVSNLYSDVPISVMHYPVALTPDEAAAEKRASARREMQADEDTVVIVQVSRLEAWKGHQLHLSALSQLKARNWVCWMVGGAQNSAERRYREEVVKMAGQLGLHDRVRFLGQRTDVSRLLAGADIFCQPNQGPEPFGIVFVEALWAARPVVATALGGALEIVNESCGILTAPGDPASLAAALERLIGSGELRSQLGQAGPARARGLCDPASQMQMLEELIRKVVRRGRQ